ncbi:sensor histidine kinase [Bacillus badius]|uniref:sensor histidine kinase n=1 Tax=Bacillus badius TaxID=1455 RepID=UPI001CC0781F|nr:sensor histidine kinase [Bacillus badius]UAT30283.1 sensor histidine kinase [Bacillus badius]
MKISAYLKERSAFLFVNVLLFLAVSVFLWVIHVPAWLIILLFLCWFTPLFTSYALEFWQRKNYYDPLVKNAQRLDQQYLLTEMVEPPDFLEGQMMYEILQSTNKQMHEHVNQHKRMQTEYREYVETWVHEIKTPIAAAKLIIDNQQNTAAKGLYEELNKIEGLVEQALYYARSSSADKDYLVKEFKLRSCVTNVLKKNAKAFIYNKIQLELAEFEDVVYSDEKWVEFILNQLIINSIKYSQADKKHIRIFVSRHEHNLVLHIADNGIGIDEKDIRRVFDKGFTGENGRAFQASTGIGLYLCKQLADKLHLGIDIQSVKHAGTEVTIIFPKSKVTLLEQ